MILDVVSTCPVCAAPIYGPKQMDNAGLSVSSAGKPAPHLTAFTCDCRQRLVLRLDLENAQAMARRAVGPQAGG